jgi:hypothetical protein
VNRSILRKALSYRPLHRWVWPAVAVVAAGLVPPSVYVASAETRPDDPTVTSQTCRTYSDAAIRAQGITDEQIPQYRALLDRMECGTVSVPLDYSKPDGRQITIAFTRLKARDQAKRLGIIAMNPGGPGASGYLMPLNTPTGVRYLAGRGSGSGRGRPPSIMVLCEQPKIRWWPPATA